MITKYVFRFLIFVFLITPHTTFAEEYFYILNDNCIVDLFYKAHNYFKNKDIDVIKDSRGLILRYEFQDPDKEFYNLNSEVYKNIEYFLAKIENPVIIEVHTGNYKQKSSKTLKNWEFSTILANNIEKNITKPEGTIAQSRVNSVGYGEFLPKKNTPNNGGKYPNRVDIIILCNVIGE